MPDGFGNFGSFGGPQQVDELAPYRPTPLETQAELQTRDRGQDEPGWFQTALEFPEKLAAHGLRGAIKGYAEGGVSGALDGLAHGGPWAFLSDWLGITDGYARKTYTTDIRRVFGDTQQSGFVDGFLNFAGDVLTDPSAFVSLFGKTGALAKLGAGALPTVDKAGNIVRTTYASVAKSLEVGERATFVLHYPFLPKVGFGIPLVDPLFETLGFKSVSLNLAKGLDAWASHARVGPVGKLLRAFSSNIAPVADPEMARAVREAGLKLRETPFAVESAYLQVFAQTPREMQEYVLKTPAAQRVLRELRERGLHSFDESHTLKAILEQPYASIMPDVGAAERAGGIAGVGDIRNATDVSRETILASQAAKESSVIGEVRESISRDVDAVASDLAKRPGAQKEFDGLIQRQVAFMEKLGDKEVAEGLLNSQMEFYVPRNINSEAARQINARFDTFLRQHDQKTVNTAMSFMQKRQFTDLTTIEANAIVYELGSKATGYIPLKELAGNEELGFFAKIFDKPFIKSLRKADPDAADFFAVNPITADFLRAKASGKALAGAEYRRMAIRAISKGEIRAADLAAKAEDVQRFADQGLVPVVEGRGGRWEPQPEADFVMEQMGRDESSRVMRQRSVIQDRIDSALKAENADLKFTQQQLQQAHDLGSIRYSDDEARAMQRARAQDGSKAVKHDSRAMTEGEFLGADFRVLAVDDHATVSMKSALMKEQDALRQWNAVRDAKRGLVGAEVDAVRAEAKATGKKLEELSSEATERLTWAKTNSKAARQAISENLDEVTRDYNEWAASLGSDAKAAKEELTRLRANGTDGAMAAKHARAYREAARQGFVNFAALSPEQQAAIARRAPDSAVHFVDPKDFRGVVEYHDSLTKPDPLRGNSIVRALDNATQFWKAWTVAPFAQSRSRDYLSGVLTYSLARGRPPGISAIWDGHAAANVFRKVMSGAGTIEELGAKHLIKGVADPRFQNVGQVLTYLADHGQLDSGFVRDTLMQSEAVASRAVGGVRAGDFVSKKMLSPRPSVNPIARAGYQVANYGDNAVKIMGFIDGLKRGETADVALDFVRTWTYSAVSNPTSFIKNIVRRAVPFGTFSHWAIGRTAEALLTKPGMVTWIDKMQRNAARVPPWDGGEIPESMNAVLPDFIKDGIGVPYKNTKTGPAYFVLGSYLPMGEVARLAAAVDAIGKPDSSGVYRYVVNQLNPFAKLLIEEVANKDSYSGAEVEAYEGQAKEMFGVAVPSRWYQAFKNIRMLSELDRLNVINLPQLKIMADAVERGTTLGNREQLPIAERLATSAFGVLPKAHQVDVAEEVRGGRRDAEKRNAEAVGRLRYQVAAAPQGQKRDQNIEALRQELLEAAGDAAQVSEVTRAYGVVDTINKKARRTMSFGRF